MDIFPAALIGLGAAYSIWILIASRDRLVDRPPPANSVYVSNGAIIGPQGTNYTITDTDLLWLGRAIVGEAGENPSRQSAAAVTWALAQNFALIPSSRGGVPRYSTFTGLIRAYAQPVNPSWAVAGQGKCLQIPSACTPDRIARRARIRALSWDSLGSVRAVVLDFKSGRLENPVPGMVDWMAGSMTGAQVTIGGNSFGIRPGRNIIG